MSDAMTKVELMQGKLPAFYKKYAGDNSVLYAVINAMADANMDSSNILDRLYDAVGIDTTDDADLERRWGSLLSLYRNNDSFVSYRNKLKLAVPSLIGGTKESIKYAIASIIGVEKDSKVISDYIRVYDAWEYAGDIQNVDRGYGNFICIIDMNVGGGAIDVEPEILNAINSVKAAGTNCTVYYIQYNINMYYLMDRFNYHTLDAIEYDKLGL